MYHTNKIKAMEINTTVFELEVLTSGFFNQATLSLMYDTIQEIRVDFETNRDYLKENIEVLEDDDLAMLNDLETQLDIVYKNLEVLKTALMKFEAKGFEHREEFEKLETHIFCLN